MLIFKDSPPSQRNNHSLAVLPANPMLDVGVDKMLLVLWNYNGIIKVMIDCYKSSEMDSVGQHQTISKSSSCRAYPNTSKVV